MNEIKTLYVKRVAMPEPVAARGALPIRAGGCIMSAYGVMSRKFKELFRCVPVVGSLLVAVVADAGAGSGGEPQSGPGAHCLAVEYDSDLAEEADALARNLTRRLKGRDVRVVLKPLTKEKVGVEEADAAELPDNSLEVDWVVHLVALLDDRILVALDSVGDDGEYDLVREVKRSDNPAETAWTVALMVEESVVPYLSGRKSEQPLGAGLAIIEPPEVAGQKKGSDDVDEPFPKLRSFGIGLAGYWIGAMDRIVAGPRFSVDGLLASRVVAGLGVAWAGTGRQSKEVNGSFYEIEVSHLPLDILFGFAVLQSEVVDLSVLAGVSAGFTIYRSALKGGSSRTDLLFDPWAQARLEAAIHVYGPLSLCVGAGAAMAMVKDALRNSGQEVYGQSRALPLFGISAQIWL